MMRVLLRRTDHPIALGYVLIACHRLMRCSAAAAWLASKARTSDAIGSLCSEIGPFSRVSDRWVPAMMSGSFVADVDELRFSRCWCRPATCTCCQVPRLVPDEPVLRGIVLGVAHDYKQRPRKQWFDPSFLVWGVEMWRPRCNNRSTPLASPR
jgi:hypothetical protein